MRQHVSTLLEVAGSVALVVGACMVSAAFGWIVGGVCALLYAWALQR